MKLVISALLAALISASCASAPKPVPRKVYQGVCRHPGVNGGEPFKIANDSEFDGPMLKLFFEAGEFVTIYGAQCVLQEIAP